jgi:Ran GTPase-activating protein (RanGAP) involved in mRNA processing and transport
LANIVQLALSGNPIGDTALPALLTQGGMTRVHELRLHSCGLWRSTADALAEARLTELHWLDLSGNGLDGIGTEVLARSRLASNLVELDLSGNSIGDAGAVSLAAFSWPLLRKLTLQSILMTNSGILELANSQTMPRLQEVHCRGNSIGWETFRKVGPRFRQW